MPPPLDEFGTDNESGFGRLGEIVLGGPECLPGSVETSEQVSDVIGPDFETQINQIEAGDHVFIEYTNGSTALLIVEEVDTAYQEILTPRSEQIAIETRDPKELKSELASIKNLCVNPTEQPPVPDEITSFNDLADWIKHHPAGGIESRRGFMSRADLLKQIYLVRTELADIGTITRNCGLRAKVRDLLDDDDFRSPENSIAATQQNLWPNGLGSHLQQGNIGDCYFLAALRLIKSHPDLAIVLPRLIESRSRRGGTVRFLGDVYQRPIKISPRDLSELEPQGVKGSKGDRLLERAYARLARENQAGEVSGARSGETVFESPSQEMAIEGGQTADAIQMILSRRFCKAKKIDEQKVFNFLTNLTPEKFGRLLIGAGSRMEVPPQPPKKWWDRVLSDPTTELPEHVYLAEDADGNTQELLTCHAYAIEGIDFDQKLACVVDPHDSRPGIWYTFEQMAQYFPDLDVVEVDTDNLVQTVVEQPYNEDLCSTINRSKSRSYRPRRRRAN